LFSIGTITILDEKVSLLSIGVLEIIIIEKFDPKKMTTNQRIVEVMPLITKLENFYVRPEISLEDKVNL